MRAKRSVKLALPHSLSRVRDKWTREIFLTIGGRMVYGVFQMKVTFELPPPVVQRLRSHVPSGERSKFVADLIATKLRNKGNMLEQAAQKANALHGVSRDMKDWEALNEYED
jgi:hypothetical protein